MIDVITRNNIPSTAFSVNATIALKVNILVKLGVINISPNQAADRLPVTADIAFKKARLFLVISKL